MNICLLKLVCLSIYKAELAHVCVTFLIGFFICSIPDSKHIDLLISLSSMLSWSP